MIAAPLEHELPAYRLDAGAVAEQLGTDLEHGLTSGEAYRRLAEDGPNVLVERPGKNPWHILVEQLTAVMVLVLIAAGAISLALGDVNDALAILAIVVLNAALGFQQEFRAERAIAALKRLAVPLVKVRRDAQIDVVPAHALVVGDILILEAGDVVPADARLWSSPNLRVQEAALTGESEPVEKDAQSICAADEPVAERRGMVFMGTAVAFGRAEAIVVATGMRTELGRIAGALQAVDRQATPLQRRLAELARWLAAVALVLVGLIFVVGMVRGEDPRTMFLTAVSLAVAAVPEGLPAVVTISLALGAQRMLKRRALVRRLLAVETLGSVSAICSDKTGTLTENRMTVVVVEACGTRLELASAAAPLPASIDLLLTAAALCNDAFVQPDAEGNSARAVGDPTETALVIAAAHFGRWKGDLEDALPRVGEVPFDSARKRMATVHAVSGTDTLASLCVAPGQYVVFAKGAVDSLLEVCTSVLTDNGAVPLSDSRRGRILESNASLAQQAMRVLGVACRVTIDPDPRHAERDLIFVGLIGMVDPPRVEVHAAVRTCLEAGIRPVMITGDHPLTAAAIARQLGIGDGQVMTGSQLDALDDDALRREVGATSVYARVSPEHKLRIVRALQEGGETVAMTGDGVNDAPALKRANIGIAMGVVGTDVAREAADMVLLDDNFATFVAAVEEGRVIYDNVRKFLKYLLATNAGELWVMLLTPLLGMPLALLPLQILWINLVTDGLPALALTLEGSERDVMRRAPRAAGERLLDRAMAVHVGWISILMAGVAIGIGLTEWRSGNPAWQTMLFTSLALLQMGHVLAIRVERASVLGLRFLGNPALLGAVLLVIALQLVVVYLPPLQAVFGTVPLTATELAVCLVLSTSLFWAVEAEKLLRRHLNH